MKVFSWGINRADQKRDGALWQFSTMIAMHGTSRVAFSVSANYQRFTTVLSLLWSAQCVRRWITGFFSGGFCAERAVLEHYGSQGNSVFRKGPGQ